MISYIITTVMYCIVLYSIKYYNDNSMIKSLSFCAKSYPYEKRYHSSFTHAATYVRYSANYELVSIYRRVLI